jgi:hypothetical protein
MGGSPVRTRLAGGGRWIRTSGSWSDLRRRDALPTGPRLPRPTCWIQFAVDSLLEGDGFESPVPQQIRSRFRESSHFSHDGLTVSRPGTGSSNPSLQRGVWCEPHFLDQGGPLGFAPGASRRDRRLGLRAPARRVLARISAAIDRLNLADLELAACQIECLTAQWPTRRQRV